MRFSGIRSYQGLGVAALLLVAWAVQPARADSDATLRERALQLNQLTGDDPMSGEVHLLGGDPTGTKKLLAVALSMTKEKDQPFNINATRVLARTAAKLNDLDTASVFYRLYADQALKLMSGHKLAQAYGGLIDLLYDNKKYEESEKICQEFLQMTGDDTVTRLKPIVLRRMIQALSKEGKTDKAIELVDSLIKAQPSNWLTLELKGWVQREAGQFADAAKTYEDVLERVNKDKELTKEEKEEFVSEIRYILSGVYVDLNQIDKAAEQLKTLIAQDEENPTYYNDLGYILADHDMSLPEAEKLIRKALDLDRRQRHKENPDIKPDEDKDNPAYLDSLGWVLYKEKKYKEARPYLLQAIEQKDGQNVEIFDHLAEIHMALGDKADAVAAWKKGLEFVGSSKHEQERKSQVEKKLKDNQ